MSSFNVGQPSLRDFATAQGSAGGAAAQRARMPDTSFDSTGRLPVIAHAPVRPVANFARMFDTYELAKEIIKKTDIASVVKLLQVSRGLRATITEVLANEKKLLRNKFDSGAWMFNGTETIAELAARERQIVRTHDSLTSLPPVKPRIEQYPTEAHGLTRITNAQSSGSLIIQWEDDKSDTYAMTSSNGLIRTHVGNFYPTTLFAGGTLVVGYEEEKKVVRRVADWERLCVLPTDPRDVDWSNYGAVELDKRWEAGPFDSYYLLCFHDAGQSAGTIEVYDELASVCHMQWFHSGMQNWTQSNKFLLTLGAQRQVARLWEFGCSEMKHEINTGSPVIRMVLTHHQWHALCENNGAQVWRSFLIADGTFSTNWSDEMNADGGAVDMNMFSDGTLVVERGPVVNRDMRDESPRATNFCILAPNGDRIGAFQHDCNRHSYVHSPVIFMDTFVVTYTAHSDMRIWTKKGELLQKINFPIGNPELMDAGFGRLLAAETLEGTVRTFYEWAWDDEAP